MCDSSLSGAEYYVSNSGNDDNPGTTPAQAWRSLAKINAFRFAPGDVIRFEKGGVWRGQLIPCSGGKEGHVTYTSYGTGPKPQLLGSVEKNEPSDWEPVGEDTWQTGPFPVDVGNIIFNNGETCGNKVWEGAALDRQNQFWYDRQSKMVKIYSRHNPATLYDDIECALTRHIISESGRSYVVYDSLHLAYGAAHGIGGSGMHDIIIRNCDLCFIGGGCQAARKTRNGWRYTRYGNGIEFWSGAHDIIVENCRIWDIYDAGLTNQGSKKNSQYNIVYRNNTIWNCRYSFEYWNRPKTSTTHDIYFENNVCYNAGGGWSGGIGAHLMFFGNSARTYNFFVRNNIFHTARSWSVVIADGWSGLENLVLDDNVYFQPSHIPLVRWRSWGDEKLFLPRDFDVYKKVSGKDAKSRLTTLPGLVVAPVRTELAVNDNQKLKVTVQYSETNTMDVGVFALYDSHDDTVAAVGSDGVVKGLRPGRTRITVTFGGATATVLVTVTP
ncbi:MAG: hypothetical protein GXP31_17775 [Kiritimatiellaeota bacterium]|nr:hypothetical protein [Kiritimatiellota bacterium]